MRIKIFAVVATLLFAVGCSENSETAREIKPALGTSGAVPRETVPVETLTDDEFVYGLDSPVLEEFSATYRLNSSENHGVETLVTQDSDSNLALTQRVGTKDVYQIILHDRVVYVRLFESAHSDNIQRDTGVKSGEWFPWEKWRSIGRKATGDPWFPLKGGVIELPYLVEHVISDFDVKPHRARVVMSLVTAEMFPEFPEACYKRGAGSEELPGGTTFTVEKLDVARWKLTCNGETIYASLDAKGRISTIAGTSDGEIDNDFQGAGVLSVSYGKQNPILRPDTTWFDKNTARVKDVIYGFEERQAE